MSYKTDDPKNDYSNLPMTSIQERRLELRQEGLTNKAIAEREGVNVSSVERSFRAIKKMQAIYGDQTLPISGTSTLRKNPGAEDQHDKLAWIKTNKTTDKMIRDAIIVIEEMTKEIQPLPKKSFPKHNAVLSAHSKKLFNMHVFADHHFGMLAWDKETGADYDLAIAEQLLTDYFRYSIQAAPDASVGIICDLADSLHFDSLAAVTPASGHVVDSDSRYEKIVATIIRVMTNIFLMMLEKYEKVHYTIVDCNHSPVGSIWLRHTFSNMFRNEPRITVDTTPGSYTYYQQGDVSLYFTHGHKKPPSQLDRIFAGKYPKVFGNTEHRYGFCGHRHSKDVIETSLMIIEQMSTLASPDAYSAGGGYQSQRAAETITYHEDYGEVSRLRATPRLLEDYAKQTKKA